MRTGSIANEMRNWVQVAALIEVLRCAIYLRTIGNPLCLSADIIGMQFSRVRPDAAHLH